MNFTKISNEPYLYLTTIGRKTGNFHTVELWFAIANEKIYLSHEGNYTDWMKNILKKSWVKFKIEKTRFQGTAKILKEKELFELGKHALYLKYYGKTKKEIIDDWFSESTIIEIIVQ